MSTWELRGLQLAAIYSLDEKFGDEDNGWNVKANVRTYVEVLVTCFASS